MLLKAIKTNFLPIFGLYISFLFKGKMVTTVQADDGMCSVVRVTEFKGTRLKSGEMKTYCNMNKVECFFKCLNTNECLSFADGVNENCTGMFCILYSLSELNTSHFLEDSNSTYNFMGSSCCNGSCLNGGLCRSKVCTCACPKDFMSTNCIRTENNTTQQFSHKWKVVNKTGSITQIDSDGVQTWATRIDNWYIFTLQNGAWVAMNGLLVHVTVGKSGVWGVNYANGIWVRDGVAPDRPYGTTWRQVTGSLKQIDAGSSGVVYGVNYNNNIYCRIGITEQSPFGTTWNSVGGKFKYVSCGDYGCWAIKPDNAIAFRTGVTFNNPQGTSWLNVDGSFVQLDAGYQGRVYAVTLENTLYYRFGISALRPTGSTWKQVEGLKVKHVTVGDITVFVIATNGTIFTST